MGTRSSRSGSLRRASASLPAVDAAASSVFPATTTARGDGHTKSEVGYALRSPSRPWWGKKTLRTAAERLQWGDESAEAALATHRPTKGSEVDTPVAVA
jgi:hypothetical protein